MKFVYLIILQFLLGFLVRGELYLYLFKKLIDFDIEYINTYKNKIQEEYVANFDTVIYEYINKNVYLKNNYVEINVKGAIKNNSTPPVDKITFLLPYHEAFQATNIQIKDEKNNELHYKVLRNVIDIDKINIDKFNNDYDIELFNVKIFEIYLNKKLKKNEKISVKLSYILGQPYFPFPIDINLNEKQNVLFYISSQILLPYNVENEEKIIIHMCEHCILKEFDDVNYMNWFEKIDTNKYVHTKNNDIRNSENYNDLNNENCFSLGNKVLFYFTSDYNLGYFEKVVKDIKISQLGYIYEKEEYILKNNSAKINKFDRYLLSDYENKYTSEENIEENNQTKYANKNYSSIIYSMQSKINYNIFEYNYFDELGKIYLIRADEFYDTHKKKNIIKFDLKPRYPILGGWKTHFCNSYYHSSNLFKIKNKQNYYAYNVDISPSIKSFYIKEMYINIYLPPYSNNISINNNNLKEMSVKNGKTKDWLDLISHRDTIQIQIQNIFPQHEENNYKNFIVMYELKFVTIFLKPLIIILITFIVILFFYFIKGLSFSFNSDKDNLKKETQERIIFAEKCKELYENLSHISDNLIQSLSDVNPQERIKIKDKFLKEEEKWTHDFIYFTKEFSRTFENTARKGVLKSYINKCFNYHSVVKKFFEAQLYNNLNINLNELAEVEKELVILLKYN
ncbi:dolichyl-diphosphooligosaccharide--protein glycosyltransferase subunit 1, putative [Plasmodium berghei]|uniref:Dolichyl-diphosphooligosaccharide--protein glycosyltransferase subunit 1 n=2 Tax=Plasmodium berghei TaxID=5821 RepID=A0A509AD92_PLABA|nr:dolichyl-diphosphooligosaccharide--protein glycosyltransferase subunit OST1, putative [Plasmodium berghei ANKA]CXI02038.1 dolichyl-diphosphooligosaccharide--protein glycosyltransferase subunit 1, putative [Plasmodium berghei]SCL91913.1 dolichyl-diphosphooligosaccharide--protein glycosyltransferase subunit 1, putative [Plasmodium berghei]SCM15555.1 dolichyl-diphosphooligosaccharide--protein glycosyltransferase subunit 1, putative [Plasmodium berghei]SCM17347.1 dolichyl-diphosphooligosaccharid|eukprot:XP_034420153.1 dolichyl-diphosphooligosaccharide--protein glycosyltransferase subunit OST1, putative [Plasmodium berghei ANKA]